MTHWLARSLAHPLLATLALALSLGMTARPAQAKYVMSANGGAAYTQLGPAFTIETPDCGHPGPHITEAMDDVLKKNVFVFHLHVKTHLDDDRCGATDRQRTEI